jgi:predicted RNA-binding Zn-ribbon protein involved in translation (DUF1610 family)
MSKPIHCDNCDWEGDLDGDDYTVLGHVEDLEVRINPGEIVPAGECPDCGALLQLGTRPEKSQHTTIDDALEILKRSIQCDDNEAHDALDLISVTFGDAHKQFFCPECGGSHFGSTQTPDGLERNCHSCRRQKGFSWNEKDDDKYFKWVITLPANALPDTPKTVTGTSCEEDA